MNNYITKQQPYAGTSTGQLHEDSDLLEFYYSNKNWDLLDSKLSEIIKSDDFSRMRFVLVIFKSFKNDPRFKHVLEKILYRVEDKLGQKLY